MLLLLLCLESGERCRPWILHLSQRFQTNIRAGTSASEFQEARAQDEEDENEDMLGENGDEDVLMDEGEV